MKTNTLANIILFYLLSLSISSFAQDAGFKIQRAQENYSHLKDSTNLAVGDAIKYISLNKNRTSYLTLGGSVRVTYDNFENQFWIIDRDLHYYAQKLAFHTAWNFGNNFRIFGEFHSGLVSGDPLFLFTDDLDLHQGFAEYRTDSKNLTIRVGRQEVKYGTGRLYDLRLGPSLRQSFDLGKVIWSEKDFTIDFFYGNAVQLNFGVFDNTSNIFKKARPFQKVWGAYGQFTILPKIGEGINTELYYLGLNTAQSTFNDVTGEETRHTIGIRRFGKWGKRFTHNHELIYQFGKIAENTISAINFETHWQYQMINTKWMPAIGLKLDWSTGDGAANDGAINSFNPMFVDPSIYGLASINTPVNIFSLHPSITLFPSRKMMIQLEYAFFYRSSIDDGLYLPPSILAIPADDSVKSKDVGNTIGLIAIYSINKNFRFLLRSTYFRSGEFITKKGLSDEVFQISPQLTFTF